jgi:DNA adenine methylase
MKRLRAQGSGPDAFAERSSAALSPQPPALAIRPLLKWAGGKRQLLPHLRGFYPAAFNRYIEPFFGSGAVFFDLHGAGRLLDRDVVLVDSNPDLIGCYETVRAQPDEVAGELALLAAAHARDGQAQYYAVRDSQFNPMRDRLRGDDGRIAYTPQLAAMLIYLNRTGFNGLFRVNARGAFNVPAGRYDRPRIADHGKLTRVAEALSNPRLTLEYGSFESIEHIARPGDFVYFDPPYAPVSRTASFTSYTGPGFSAEDQQRLQRLTIVLAARGCFVLLSNSTADEIERLYERNDDARAAGLRAIRVPARRAINSNTARRGPVEEYLITNVVPWRRAEP